MYWSGNLFSYNGYFTEIDGIEADGQDGNNYRADEGYFSDSLLRQILDKNGIEIVTFFDLKTRDMGFESYFIPVNIWSSQNSTSLKEATYEGTQWEEDVIYFSTPYWVIDLNKKLPIEKTKDGYFYVDMSNVEPGRYFVYQEFGDQSTPTKYGGTIDVT